MSVRVEPDYERVILTGRIKTRARLRIGSGLGERSAAAAEDPEETPRLLLTACRDAAGAPYIPASTLRGFLRRQAEGAAELRVVERLFGCARRALPDGLPAGDEGQDIGRAGALRVYDARLDPPGSWALTSETRIAIDPVTGTVRNRFLFTEEAIPAGACFRCRFELDRIRHDDLDTFIRLLARFDGAERSGIGAGRSRRRGRLAWRGNLDLRTLTRQDYRRWLGLDRPLAQFYQQQQHSLPPAPDDDALASGPADPDLRLVMHIDPQSPLLVSIRQPKRHHDDPERVYQTDDGRVYVPAASLKGMLHGQARRILLTMLADRAPDTDLETLRTIADALLGEVFGDTERIAALWVGEGLEAPSTPADAGPAQPRQDQGDDDTEGTETGFDADDRDHDQTFIAIDRFTGGVAHQRLYKVRAATPERLRCVLLLRERLLRSEWALGLLCYLLRDALEGDLRLGWGRARGYGQIRMIQAEAGTADTPWPEVLAKLQQTLAEQAKGTPADWAQALEDEIAHRLDDAKQDSTEAAET